VGITVALLVIVSRALTRIGVYLPHLSIGIQLFVHILSVLSYYFGWPLVESHQYVGMSRLTGYQALVHAGLPQTANRNWRRARSGPSQGFVINRIMIRCVLCRFCHNTLWEKHQRHRNKSLVSFILSGGPLFKVDLQLLHYANTQLQLEIIHKRLYLQTPLCYTTVRTKHLSDFIQNK
jgi:hypothetical protein